MIKKKHKSKYWIGQIHLWLGLASGLIVFIVSITGCIFTFQKEISEAIYHDVYFVAAPTQGKVLPLSTLKQNAELALGKTKPVNFITTFREADRAWEFMAFKGGDEHALTYFGTVAHYESVFINPYTGKVTGNIDFKHNFFVVVKYLHWSLLLNTDYGQPIVGWSTFIFVIMLITGMILWWPKTWSKANFNKSFKIKWNASFKRVNYDLHNVPGFYAMLIALVLALTGMVWAFKWFQTTVYVVASRSITPPSHKETKSVKLAQVVSNPLDIAYQSAQQQVPEADRFGVSPAFGAEGVVYISGYRGKEVYYDTDELQYDQYSGKLLNRLNFSQKNAGEKIIRMNYDIHVGAILGLPGKILVFIVGLVAASLPITGFLIWLGRKKKKKSGI